MLDIKFIREYPDHVREGIRKKGDVDRVDEVLSLDARRRELLQRGEALKAKRNEVSDEIGKLKRGGGDAAKAIGEMEQVKQQIKTIDDELRTVEEQFNTVMLQIPNVPHPSVPEGKTPADNQEVAKWGSPPVIDFKPK